MPGDLLFGAKPLVARLAGAWLGASVPSLVLHKAEPLIGCVQVEWAAQPRTEIVGVGAAHVLIEVLLQEKGVPAQAAGEDVDTRRNMADNRAKYEMDASRKFLNTGGWQDVFRSVF